MAAAALVAAPVATSAALPAAPPGPAGLPAAAEVTLASAAPAWVTAPSAASPRLSGRPAGVQRGGRFRRCSSRCVRQRLAEAAVARGEVLSQAEYDRRFGVPQAQVDAVATWLRSPGPHGHLRGPRRPAPSGPGGSVAALQRALHTTLATAVRQGHAGLVPVTVARAAGLARCQRGPGARHHGPGHRRRACGAPPYPRPRRGRSGAPAAARRPAGDTRCAHYWGEHVNTAVKPYANESNYLCGGYRPLQLAAMYGVTSARHLAPTVAILGAYDAKAMKAATNTYMARYHYPTPGRLHRLPAGKSAVPVRVRWHGWMGQRAGSGRPGLTRHRPCGQDPLLRFAQLRARRHADDVPAGGEGPQGLDRVDVVRLPRPTPGTTPASTTAGTRRPCRHRWPVSASSPPPVTTATTRD